MTPDIVVDVGNTRVKWGLCRDDAVIQMAALAYVSADWDRMRDDWRARMDVESRPLTWALSGVVPDIVRDLHRWACGRGDRVEWIQSNQQVPIESDVEAPDRVGIDRLLTALAATRRVAGQSAILVSAGSAVTVDFVDARGVFRGGTIFPGFRLMAEALHRFTAKLPRVDDRNDPPTIPGKNTVHAIQAGIAAAVAGGVERIAGEYRLRFDTEAALFVTGGDADRVAHLLRVADPIRAIPTPVVWPEQTLEGVRLAAEALP